MISSSIYLHHHTMLEQMSIIFVFNMTKPCQSILLNTYYKEMYVKGKGK